MIVGDPEQRARDLARMADGIEALGGPGRRPLTALCRLVAADSLELAEQLAAERSARVALQERCERQQEILGQAAYEACVDANR